MAMSVDYGSSPAPLRTRRLRNDASSIAPTSPSATTAEAAPSDPIKPEATPIPPVLKADKKAQALQPQTDGSDYSYYTDEENCATAPKVPNLLPSRPPSDRSGSRPPTTATTDALT